MFAIAVDKPTRSKLPFFSHITCSTQVLGANLDFALEPREDHASSIANWLEVLEGDSRAVFTAASPAQRAADYTTRLARRACAETKPAA